MNNLIYSLKGEDDMEARCFRLSTDQISVTLCDLESGETLPTIKIFDSNDLDRAIAYANSLVDSDE